MRLNGGVIGASNQPTNRAAPGIWSAEELRTNQLYGKFPRYYEGWDLTYLINTTPVLLNTTTATGIATGSGLEFKPDGTRMYVLDSSTGGELAEFALSTAWDSSTASLSSVSADTTVGQGVAIRPDGRAFFACGTTNPSVKMHTMTTPWTASTAVLGNFVSILSEDSSPTGIAFSTDGTNMYVLGDVGNDLNQYSLDPAWAVSTATYVRTFNTSAYNAETFPRGVTFKPDGTRMYVVGSVKDNIEEYSLSTAWNISTASSVRLKSLSLQDTESRDIRFKDDGTKLYILGADGDEINEYSLSTAWDISTASFVQVFSITLQETEATGLFFKSDGSGMYVLGQTGDDVNEYSLSTPWNISTASFVRSFSIASQDVSPHGLAFNDDGTRMYVVGIFYGRVYEYNLSTAWDISTATYGTLTNTLVPSPNDIRFKPDGTKMYTVSAANNTVREYDLSEAWDIFTASFLHEYTVAEAILENGLEFSSDGLFMYLVDNNGGVYKYNLATAWNVSTASFAYRVLFPGMTAPQSIKLKSDDSKMFVTQGSSVFQYSLPVAKELRSPGDEGASFAVGQAEVAPAGLDFSYDGTKMYVVGPTNDRIFQYALSTPWNLSSASYTQNTAIGTQETTPTGVYFKPDGTNMYVIGSASDNVHQYSLSTAWDVSTATFVVGRSVSAQDTAPADLYFKPDGTKLYVVGTTGDDVNEYNLSTAWDISTTSFVQVFSVAGQDNTPTAMAFRPDGLRMFVVGATNDGIHQYDLTTPWDISTASYTKQLRIDYLESAIGGLSFKTDGTKLYLVGTGSDRVFELNLG
jgi:DNA-binding beta-propeller fold protein YncE